MIRNIFAATVLVALAMTSSGHAQQTEMDVASATLYGIQCAPCHGMKLEGGQFGPALSGEDFAKRWSASDAALLEFISTNMPPSAAGSMSDAEYEQITAYILKTNNTAMKAVRAPGEPAAVPPQNKAPASYAPNPFQDEVYTHVLGERKDLLSRLSPVTPAMLKSPPPQDWLSWRRTQDDSGFSPLDGINKANVAGLKLKWAWSARNGRNEIAPIVHDGVMFINSLYDVEALDAKTGMRLWRYRRNIPAQFKGPLNMIQKSMAISGRRLYVPTADRHLVALDVGTGEVVWDTEIISASSPSATVSAGPLVAGDVLVQGTSVGPFCKAGCFILGIDANTGKQLWRFNTVAKDNSWNGTPPEERSGGSVWNTASYDPDLDLVYIGTGNVYDIGRLLRPATPPPGNTADALYSNSTLAIHPKTGKLAWYHQHFPHEVWDLDEVFERTLMNVPVNGKPERLSVSIGKVGVLDALDRATGRYMFSVDLGLNNLVTAIDPKTGARTTDPAKLPKPNTPVELCPSVQGSRNWMATAFNPNSRILYIPMLDMCMDFTWTDSQIAADTKMGMAWRFKPHPGSDGTRGVLVALDMVSHKPLWTERMRAAPLSSFLATGGGLVFGGNSDRSFQARDDKTGKVLWETRLSGPPNATPVTFSIDGHQYVAISTGGGASHEADTTPVAPEFAPGAPSTTIWVFGL